MTNFDTTQSHDSIQNMLFQGSPASAVVDDNLALTPSSKYEQWLKRSLGLCINRKIQNKHDQTKPFPNKYFEPTTLTIEALTEEIRRGHAFCPLMEGERHKQNFVSSDLIVIDIDEGLTLEQAEQHPLVADCATLIYTSASHTAEHHRFRIVFVLESTITDPEEYEMALNCFVQEFGADRKARSAASLFYGNTDAQIFLHNKGLSNDRLDAFLATAAGGAPKKVDFARSGATKRGMRCIAVDEILTTANGRQGTLDQLAARTKIHCPRHDDKNPSANVYQTYTGTKFIRCYSDKCDATYWPVGIASHYQFDDFEQAALKFEKSADPNKMLGEYNNVSVHSCTERLVNASILSTDLTFIKSGKGTGKTEALEKIFQGQHNFRVLSIGHRRSLVRHLCEKLGMNCYLDDKSRKDKGWYDRYGVCLDSLTKMQINEPYDCIILDESEQILSHFLSGTMKGKELDVFKRFKTIIARAKHVIAMDADLSWMSYNTLSDLVVADSGKRSNVYINLFQPGAGKKIERFRSQHQLVGDLMRSIEQGKRCYVVSNTKDLVNKLTASILEQHPDKSILSITADTANEKNNPATLFLSNPEEEAKKYQVVISSPAVSSGISLKFKDEPNFYDIVYGFFDAGITDHFECDQQLARVRSPQSIKVFVSPAEFHLETDMDIVIDNIRQKSMFAYLRDELPNGQIEYKESDDLLRLAMRRTAQKRASINELRQNFYDYKRKQGFAIERVADDPELIEDGKEVLTNGKSISSETRTRRLMEATYLSPEELRPLIKKGKQKDGLTRKETNALERARIERFYRRDIFEGLIDLDQGGILPERVKRFEALCSSLFGRLRDSNPPQQNSGRLAAWNDQAVQLELLAEAFRIAGLYDNCRFHPDVEVSKKSLADFVVFMKDNKHLYESQFGKTLSADLDINPVGQLRNMLAMVNLKFGKAREVNENTHRYYYYKLDPRRLSGMEKLQRVRDKRETDWPEIDC